MEPEQKQMLVMLLLESPLLVFMMVARYVQQGLLAYTGDPRVAQVLYVVAFVLVAIFTAFLFVAIQLSATRSVAGKRFLVGHAYSHDGRAEPIQLELGSYSLLGEFDYEGEKLKVYAVYGDGVIQYVLLSPRELEELLTTASEWTIYTDWWYAEAQVYPVTLHRFEGKAVDVIRQDYNLPMDVPIYAIRDNPAGVVVEKLGESVAEQARRKVDELRSLQLYAENVALRQALESYRAADRDLKTEALKMASAYVEEYLLAQKKPKQRTWKLDKWTALVIVAIIVAVTALAIARMYVPVLGR